jgi:hypothetical protein
MGAAAPVVVHIFRDIGELREMAESANHGNGGLVAQLIQYHFQLVARPRILFAPKSNCGLTDVFHQVERGLSLLFAQGVSQHAPQEADILSQGVILYRPFLVLIIDVIFIESCISGGEESHNEHLSAKLTPRCVKCASVRAGVCHAKIHIRSSPVNFSTS